MPLRCRRDSGALAPCNHLLHDRSSLIAHRPKILRQAVYDSKGFLGLGRSVIFRNEDSLLCLDDSAAIILGKSRETD